LRSSLDHGTGNFRSRLPGDKVTISEWTPPTQSMRASNLMEQDQLRTLVAYVQGIEDELTKHNQLRSSMLLAVSLVLNFWYLGHTNMSIVHTSPLQRSKGYGELGEEVLISLTRDC
jgi:hypothetical protein